MKNQTETPLSTKLNAFVSLASKSKIAIVVPLFGYWSDSHSQQLDEKTLKIVLDRLYSNIHQVYTIFVAEDRRMSANVGNILVARNKGGNSQGIPMSRGATYGEYLHDGINAALKDTKCNYIVCINPWVLIQYDGIDVLIDRINKGDAKVISGFNVNGVIDGSAFDGHIYNLPRETRDIDINFFGMTRAMAELITFDERYKTHSFIGRDLWQSTLTKGFESIVSQKIPIFTFDMDWTEYETPEQFQIDKSTFENKWRFGDESIKYGK